MDLAAFIHEPKGALSYAYDSETLHIRIKTKKDDIQSVTLLAIDPFNWKPVAKDSHVYDFAIDTMQHVEMKKEYVTRYHDCWFAELPGFNWRRIKYGFVLNDGHECCFAGCQQFVPLPEDWTPPKDHTNYFYYPYILEEDLYEAPTWVKDTVWYQIFPDRFNRGSAEEDAKDREDLLEWGSDELDGVHKKFGGNLQGVIEKLDYIRDLGCDGIYFTPIFDSPSSHKYDTKDYFKIDPHFGDNDKLGLLVEEAHKRGIRVMLDAVFNHCGYEHPFWQDVLKHGSSSPYFDYFYILDADKPVVPDTALAAREGYYFGEHLNYRTFAYTEQMPKWNTANPAAREYLISAAVYWTEHYNIDGWRLDVANEVSHDFWREFRKRIKAIRKDIYILGENWLYSNPWLQGDQFDAVMNYEFTGPVTRYFGTNLPEQEQYTAEDFVNAINQLLVSYPKHVARNMFNLLDSHDTARILHFCGDDPELVKLPYVFLLTYGGSPSIYYGGEVGLGGDEHHNRQCMPWKPEQQNLALYQTIRRLIGLRKENPLFKAIDIEWLSAGGATNTLIYKKESSSGTLYVLIHNSSEPADIGLPSELQGRKMRDLYNDQPVETAAEIRMESHSFRLLAAE
ncbi:glycoside hydrolase family 13 protein [Paenibacillus pedocola]|uniref:glycoside hydrolase family 13 protein n=1 Tax=Paenibacillus pedocola TaxID=3242193 RepID=UPI0028776908|nr:glycoside hydrolase family 13 protein [Paenibacillus typhae]